MAEVRRAVLAAAGLVLLLTAGGCPAEDNVSKTATMGAGKHTITKVLRGYWKADDAGPGCKWVIQRKSGEVIQRGQYERGNESQAVILGTGTLGLVFWPNDACGTWRR
jgi:hypothetical protein